MTCRVMSSVGTGAFTHSSPETSLGCWSGGLLDDPCLGGGDGIGCNRDVQRKAYNVPRCQDQGLVVYTPIECFESCRTLVVLGRVVRPDACMQCILIEYYLVYRCISVQFCIRWYTKENWLKGITH